MRFDDRVASHIDWIARLAFRYCRRREDAEDLAQETLCRIYANRDKFADSRDFKPWVVAIMSNIFKTQRARRSLVQFCAIADYDAPTSEMADDAVMLGDAFECVRRAALLSIGVECVMLYAQGYSYYEIADIVGINVGTVKSRVASGREAIAKAVRHRM